MVLRGVPEERGMTKLYCPDCRHCSWGRCYHPEFRDVTGSRPDLAWARHQGACGVEGKMFEARPVEKERGFWASLFWGPS